MSHHLGIVVAAIAIAGCNPQIKPVDDGKGGRPPAGADGGAPLPPGIPGVKSIAVLPANQTLTIDGTTPATGMYKAIGTFEDGHTEDISARVAFRLADPSMGSFDKQRFTSATDRGGRTEVLAATGTQQGQTPLNLLLKKRAPDPLSPGLPANPGTRFGGTVAPGRAPELVYPNDGVLLPPNLGRLEIHFLPGAGNTLFELAFSNGLTDVRLYTTCRMPMGNGCIYPMTPELWRWVAETNRGGEPVTVTVKGTDGAAREVGESPPLELSFSRDDLQGAIYYWTTSSGTAIMRYDFASTTQTMAERFIGTELSNGNCIGCHAVSHEGNKMVAAAGTPRRGQLLLMDVGTRQPILRFPPEPSSLFESWSPDDKQYVGVWGELQATNFNLLLFDGDTGALTGMIDVGATRQNPTTHPDWALDGTRIVYTRIGTPVLQGFTMSPRLQEIHDGSIHMVTSDGNGWSAPAEIVPAAAGKNRYYPAFSPDSSFIVFDESTCAGGIATPDCDADSDPSARLFAVMARPGATPVELARANAGGKLDMTQDLTTSYPKWSPFVFQSQSGEGSRLEWMTFSSSRMYGLRPPPPSDELPAGLLLWMAAANPDAVPAGQDPSYPAFVLPFQDITTSNHIAQWTKRVVIIK